MSCKKPDVARRLRRVKTETDKEIVASYEARRRIKLRAIKEVRVKMGKEENCDEKKRKKGRNQRKEKKKGCANVKRCKNLCEEKDKKKAQICNSMNTSVGVQNRVALRRTIDSEKDTIEEMTRFCLVGGGLKHGMLVHC